MTTNGVFNKYNKRETKTDGIFGRLKSWIDTGTKKAGVYAPMIKSFLRNPLVSSFIPYAGQAADFIDYFTNKFNIPESKAIA